MAAAKMADMASAHVTAHMAATAHVATATVTGKCHVEGERDRRRGDRSNQSRHCLFHSKSPSGCGAAGVAPRTDDSVDKLNP
jgi:hypothetical protein